MTMASTMCMTHCSPRLRSSAKRSSRGYGTPKNVGLPCFCWRYHGMPHTAQHPTVYTPSLTPPLCAMPGVALHLGSMRKPCLCALSSDRPKALACHSPSTTLWAPTLFLRKTSCIHVQRPSAILLLLSLRIYATRTATLQSLTSTPGPFDTNCTCIFSERYSISLDAHGKLPCTEPPSTAQHNVGARKDRTSCPTARFSISTLDSS
jgi:hypothetical protein